MGLNLKCREAVRLMLAENDLPLQTGERWRLRFHLLICRNCERFSRQNLVMRTALDQWRNYTESEGGLNFTPDKSRDNPPTPPA